MIQLSRNPALSCSRPATARKSARPAAMSSSEAPADAAAAAAPSAFEMLCAPPACKAMALRAERALEREARCEAPALDRLHDVLRLEVRIAPHAEGDEACGGATPRQYAA
jgi:hypothetical protein